MVTLQNKTFKHLKASTISIGMKQILKQSEEERITTKNLQIYLKKEKEKENRDIK